MKAEDSALLRSPLDHLPLQSDSLVQIGRGATPGWVPSRFNVQATAEDGRLVLWNSYSGSMSVFKGSQRAKVRDLLRRKGFRARREGLVAYMADRGFLLREGSDELRRVHQAFGREQYRSDTLELILLASEDCNFRCSYCYESFERGTMRPEVRQRIVRLVERRLPRLSHLGISWFGGEPLYGLAAIEELAPFFVETVDRHNLSFTSHMTTNGYLLSPEVAERLLTWRIRDFQITLDGTAEDHDRLRPARDGRGTFEVIFSNLQALSQRREELSVTIRINFDRESHPRLVPFLDQIEHAFRDDPRFSLAFHAVGRWGGPNDADLAVCGSGESRQVKAALSREARRRGLNIAGGLREVRGAGAQVCYAARPYNFVIGADGQVMKCTIVLDKADYNVVGRLGDDGELELDEDKMARWTEPAFAGDAQCRKCVILPSCQGIHCPKIRIEEGRTPCPDTRLTAKRELTELLTEKEGKARPVSVAQSAGPLSMTARA